MNKYHVEEITRWEEIPNEKLKEIVFEMLDHLKLYPVQCFKNGHETHIDLKPKD